MPDQAPTTDWRCRVCRRAYAPNATCVDCQRLQAYGALIAFVLDEHQVPGRLTAQGCDLLDAVASLMGSVTRLRRQHNREVSDEQRDAQRDARSAYHEGFVEGQHSGRE